MLPELNLDQEKFEDMVEEMRNQISSICPSWTDFNAHDPGITLIELFAWLQEIQQYHMNQISSAQLAQYLHLLGEKRLGRRAARTLLELSSDQPSLIRAGSRFKVGEFWFETERECLLPGPEILFCGVWEQGEWTVIDGVQLSGNGKMELFPFGRRPEVGTCLYLGLSRPFETGRPEWLSVLTGKNDRNPITEDGFSLSDLAFEYHGADGWRPLSVLRDASFGFLQDGFLTISCETDMTPVSLQGRRTWGIRIRLMENGYEAPPVVTGLSFSHVEAVQKKTAARGVQATLALENREEGLFRVTAEWKWNPGEQAECWLQYGNRYRKAECGMSVTGEGMEVLLSSGEKPDGARVLIFEDAFAEKRNLSDGDGFPFQQVELESRNLLAKEFELMVEDPEDASFMRVWSQVDNFHGSGPADCHYILDETEGRLLFGDGFHGMMPEGKMVISGWSESLGESGNINAADFSSGEVPWIRAVSCFPASGGRDPESFDEAFLRVSELCKLPGQALTLKDYERLALQTPGLMLQACRAYVTGESQITVAVMPQGGDGAGILSHRAAMAVRRYLERFRVIGTAIRVKSPEYVQISVTVQLYVNPRYYQGRQMAEEAIRRYFEDFRKEMGKPLLYRSLRMLLERLDCVEKIGYLVLDGRGGSFRRNSSGDILLPPDGVGVLRNLECMILDS